MKILKLLNKKNLSIIIFSLLITSSPFAEDKPVDIWDIEKIKGRDFKKLNNFFWLFSIDLKSSKNISISIIENWIKKNPDYY